jgi:serine/threonine-protein kinase RsbW
MANEIKLTVPATAEYLSLVRLATGVAASRLDMAIDEIDDLQLAVEELCLPLVGRQESKAGQLKLRAEWDADVIEIRCSVEHSNGASSVPTLPADLSLAILNALVDEHGAEDKRGRHTAWLKKTKRSLDVSH